MAALVLVPAGGAGVVVLARAGNAALVPVRAGVAARQLLHGEVDRVHQAQARTAVDLGLFEWFEFTGARRINEYADKVSL